jgi:hypothetical protein
VALGVDGAIGRYGGCATVLGLDGLKTGGGSGVGGGIYCACACSSPTLPATMRYPIAKSSAKNCAKKSAKNWTNILLGIAVSFEAHCLVRS